MNPVLEQVGPETAALLAAQALDAYLKQLLGMPEQKNAFAALSDEEFATLLEEFSSGTEGRPPLPADFSRKDIYFDHD
jgi:hypothetical protein